MIKPDISPGITTLSNFKPSIFPDSSINTAVKDIRHHKRRIAQQPLKDATGQFAAALAHEVRNPLTNINLSVQMLELMSKDIDLKVYLDIISRSSERINELMTQFLTIQGGIETQAERYSIPQLLDEVLEMARDRTQLKNILITREYIMKNCRRVVNVSKMKIALTNIIINAIDAMSKGKGELKVSTKSVEGRYIIHIEDNGCGISKENLHYIFKPFFTNKPGGLGIGLSATQEILKSNQVEVIVESKEGKGTRFTLLFDKKLVA